MLHGTDVIKTAAHTSQRKQKSSNDTNEMFMIYSFTKNQTNSKFMILMSDGTTAIKTAAHTKLSKQAPSDYTNSTFMILMFGGTTRWLQLQGKASRRPQNTQTDDS